MASLLNINSDDSDNEGDCDYVPRIEESSEDSDENENCGDNFDQLENTKRVERKNKLGKSSESNDNTEKEIKPEITAEEESKRVDELWNQFQMDVRHIRKPSANNTLTEINNESRTLNGTKMGSKRSAGGSKVNVTEVYDFAGEEVEVTKEVVDKTEVKTKDSALLLSPQSGNVNLSTRNASKRSVGGLAAALDVISKKPKLSTLQKSAYDWRTYKRSEGIEEELEQHNRGKDGFLEKQAFLQRSDLRQFEIEKSIRNISRCKKS